MATQHGLSRRRMLAMSAAAGSLVVGGGYRGATAQGAKRIERLDPALDAIIDSSEPIVDIATNLGGTANVEGPLWWKEGGHLLFRAPPAAMEIYARQPIAPAGHQLANGITRDMQAGCGLRGAERRITREATAPMCWRELKAAVNRAQRCRGEIRRCDLLHRPVDRGGGARRDRHTPGGSTASRLTAARLRCWSTTVRPMGPFCPTRACSHQPFGTRHTAPSILRRTHVAAPDRPRFCRPERPGPVSGRHEGR